MSEKENVIFDSLSWLYQKVRAFLAFRFTVIVLTAFISGMGTYVFATYGDIAVRFEKKLPNYEVSRAKWIESSAKVFTNANVRVAENARLPDKRDIRNIQTVTNELITNLSTVPTPTKKIEESANDFKVSLFDIVRELGRYNGSPEAFTRIVEVSNTAAELGDVHREVIESYLGSTTQRLRGAIR